MEAARAGHPTDEMKRVASDEGMEIPVLMDRMAHGEIVIPKNRVHNIRPIGIGNGLRTKVNANIGSSTDRLDTGVEFKKARVAVECGADAVMDLSTGGDVAAIRKTVMEAAPVCFGTVPIYQAAVEVILKRGDLNRMDPDGLFRVIEEQAGQGVDFITVHCGVTLESVERMNRQGRLLDIVSRGGSFLVSWMLENGKENPLYEQFDRLLDIARAYDVTLSLGDGMRPGCLADATDRAQIQELILLGELTQRAWERDVQVLIEGPGHVPLNQIGTNIQLQKKICSNAPFYVLGPLVTDVAPGYDHITSAIGGALAGAAGADFLCYVTPGEHLRIPTPEDVREGVIAARIAAHAADLAKGVPGAWDWDRRISKARKDMDWDSQIRLAIDPERAQAYRDSVRVRQDHACSMCGDFCAIRIVEKALEKHP
ncbi:phosphomethylpyrimidine synthase ThiC [bacterium]|nr:phosphomethylpyrimidine synthase ThiC [bacterium]